MEEEEFLEGPEPKLKQKPPSGDLLPDSNPDLSPECPWSDCVAPGIVIVLQFIAIIYIYHLLYVLNNTETYDQC